MNKVTHHWLKSSSVMCRSMKEALHFQSVFSLSLIEKWSHSHPGSSPHPVLELSNVNIRTTKTSVALNAV